MLGHNIPKPVATGKIARDIREAVKQSFSQSGHEEKSDLQKHKSVIIWKQIMDCHFKVERLSDFSVLDSFECGVAQMDNFIHGNLKYCDANHYCSTFVVRDIINMDVWPMYKTIWVK